MRVCNVSALTSTKDLITHTNSVLRALAIFAYVQEQRHSATYYCNYYVTIYYTHNHGNLFLRVASLHCLRTSHQVSSEIM